MKTVKWIYSVALFIALSGFTIPTFGQHDKKGSGTKEVNLKMVSLDRYGETVDLKLFALPFKDNQLPKDLKPFFTEISYVGAEEYKAHFKEEEVSGTMASQFEQLSKDDVFVKLVSTAGSTSFIKIIEGALGEDSGSECNSLQNYYYTVKSANDPLDYRFSFAR